MKRADWILIICIALLAGALWLYYRINGDAKMTGAGGQVVVTINGEEYQRFDLTGDIRMELPTVDGNSVLVITDGNCFMESAHCPDQICVKHKPIQMTGESIICLPYRIVVSIEGNGEAEYENK